MANYDNYAFDAMNENNPDRDITGGAIAYSEYEMDMTPKQQEKYRKALMGTLEGAYRSDPHKGKLDFNKWLDNLKPDLVMERARKWRELREEGKGPEQEDYRQLEDAGLLESLLMKHTGKLEDVRDVIGKDTPRPLEEFVPTPMEFRK